MVVWARLVGVHPRTAYLWVREDRMPVPISAVAVGQGTILGDVAEAIGDQRVVLDAGVSSHDQRSDLDRLVSRLTGGPPVVGSRWVRWWPRLDRV